MPDAASLPPFRPLAQKRPDIECVRKPDGTVYLKQRHKPGDRPRSVPHALAMRAEMHPDRDWLKQRNPETDQWEAITYGEGLKRTRALAQAFLDQGAGPDAPVMILSGNSIETALVMVAAMTIGAPAAPISVPYSLMSTDFAKLNTASMRLSPKSSSRRSSNHLSPQLRRLAIMAVRSLPQMARTAQSLIMACSIPWSRLPWMPRSML